VYILFEGKYNEMSTFKMAVLVKKKNKYKVSAWFFGDSNLKIIPKAESELLFRIYFSVTG
jgi:hypothetical protein